MLYRDCAPRRVYLELQKIYKEKEDHTERHMSPNSPNSISQRHTSFVAVRASRDEPMIMHTLASASLSVLLLKFWPTPSWSTKDLPATYIIMYWHSGKLGDGQRNWLMNYTTSYGVGGGFYLQQYPKPYGWTVIVHTAIQKIKKHMHYRIYGSQS